MKKMTLLAPLLFGLLIGASLTHATAEEPSQERCSSFLIGWAKIDNNGQWRSLNKNAAMGKDLTSPPPLPVGYKAVGGGYSARGPVVVACTQ